MGWEQPHRVVYAWRLEQPVLNLRRRPAISRHGVGEARGSSEIFKELEKHPLELASIAQTELKPEVDTSRTNGRFVD
jgi:hypothetical protein